MEKFCTKCGKELKDGKPCSCTDKKEVLNEKKVYSRKETVCSNDFLTKFSKPVDFVDDYLSDNKNNTSLIIILITSLLMSFVYIDNIVTQMSMFNPYMRSNVYFKEFVIFTVLFGIGFIVFDLIISLVSKYLFKHEINLNTLIDITGVSLIPVVLSIILAIIESAISYMLGSLMVILGVIVFSLFFCYGLYKSKINKNSIIYIFLISLLISILIISII